MAAPGRVEADFSCLLPFPAPPQLALEHLHVVEWGGVGAIYLGAGRGRARHGRFLAHGGRTERVLLSRGECARRPVGRTQSGPYWVGPA